MAGCKGVCVSESKLGYRRGSQLQCHGCFPEKITTACSVQSLQSVDSCSMLWCLLSVLTILTQTDWPRGLDAKKTEGTAPYVGHVKTSPPYGQSKGPPCHRDAVSNQTCALGSRTNKRSRPAFQRMYHNDLIIPRRKNLCRQIWAPEHRKKTRQHRP